MNYNLASSGTAYREGIMLQKNGHATGSKKKIIVKGNSLIKYSIQYGLIEVKCARLHSICWYMFNTVPQNLKVSFLPVNN